MRGVLASLREFCGKVARRWYAVGIGVTGGILGIVDAVSAAAAKPKTAPFSVPLWLWLPLLAGGFLVAIIWAFHDVRMEREDMRTQRDAAKAEIERRFDALRYALSIENIGTHTDVGPDGTTGDVAITFVHRNNSPEYLRYEIEDADVIIQGREADQEDPGFAKGTVIPPHGTAQSTCSPIRSVPILFQYGILKLTIKYGHPSASLRFRKSWERKLRARSIFGATPGRHVQIVAELVSDPEVEDI